MEFKTFVEVKNSDGYWIETNIDTGFLASYCSDFDGYITENLFIGLSNIKDLQFSLLFRRPMIDDISRTVKYKINMLACLGDNSTYYLTLAEINLFDWSREIYGSSATVTTTFHDVAPDFLLYYVSALSALGSPDQVRLIILKKG